MDSLLITADWVLPITAPPFERGGVRIEGGRIVQVGTAGALDAAPSSAARIELGRAALLPGLVNTHVHLELTALRGYLEEADFFAWIRKLTETKYTRLDEEDVMHSARWGVIEATRAGITTVGEVADFGVSLQALREGGLRGVFFQEVFGPDPHQAAASLEQLEKKLHRHRLACPDRIRLGVSPHAPYSVSADLFRRVGELARAEGLPLSIHAAESRAERAFVRAAEGPFAEFLRQRGLQLEPPRCSSIEYLDRLGLLSSRLQLVHCVDCSEGDLRRIAGSGASVAHCPKSNAKLGHGVAPVRAMRRLGVRVGLGTDGVVSNNTFDLFEEARFAALLERAARARDGALGEAEPPAAASYLRLMTIEGARALGLDRDAGSLEEGKAGDLCAVSLDPPHLQPVHDIESAILWGASARDVVLTIAGGEVLFETGRVRRLDEDAVARSIAGIARKLKG